MDRISKPGRGGASAAASRPVAQSRLKKALSSAPADSRVRRGLGAMLKAQGDGELLLAPKDLRASDPSLAHEMRHGQFGLDGIFVHIGPEPAAVWEAPFADDGFWRELHSFPWLRDLRAACAQEEAGIAGIGADEGSGGGGELTEEIRLWHEMSAREMAQRMFFAWREKFGNESEGPGFKTIVIARRVKAMIMHASFLLDGLDAAQRRIFMRVLHQQIALLQERLVEEPDGLGRVEILSSLALAGLSLARRGGLLNRAAPQLMAALREQIMDDGGHISRNPGAVLDILFNIIPLRECYVGAGRSLPEGMGGMIDKMFLYLRFMRMGDASLARFNGQSHTPTDALASLLGLDEKHEERGFVLPGEASSSAYCRIEDGPLTAIMDCGAAGGDMRYDHAAHAGCLSFEMSVRHYLMVVNSGAYDGEDESWREYARSTAAHSTLAIDDYSSAGQLAGGAMVGPKGARIMASGKRQVSARHEGYAGQFGVIHSRSLEISSDGLRLSGRDGIAGGRPGDGKPFAIRFHLHPFVELTRGNEDNLLLTLPDGEIWRFHAQGAAIHLEDSVYLAYKRGPQMAHQIVLRGKCGGNKTVSWLLEKSASSASRTP
jgi:uncharacterized heparinase superfamily protein